MADQAVMQTVRFLEQNDYPLLLAFLDRIFDEPGGFRELLPAIYCDPEIATRHVGIKSDSRIIAAAGCFPIEWHVGSRVLRIAGIGSVAVDPGHRGGGLMSRMMNFLIDHIRSEQYDLSYLGGQRQRYRHFGWEKAGSRFEATVSFNNFKGRRLRPLQLEDAAGATGVNPAILDLHQNQPAWCRRNPALFSYYLQHWRCRPVWLRDENNRDIGYATVKVDEKRVMELKVTDPAEIGPALHALLLHFDLPEVTLVIHPLDCESIREVAQFAETVKTIDCCNWRIFNLSAVLTTLLSVSRRGGSLTDGQVVLKVSDTGESVGIKSANGRVEACEVNQDADIEVDSCTLTQLLFGPLLPSQVLALPATCSLLDHLFPVALSIDPLDCV